MKFWGYRRPDGSVGIRNYVVILPMSECEANLVLDVADQIGPAVTPLIHNHTLMHLPEDDVIAKRVLIGWGCNPNVFGVVILTDGNNAISPEEIKEGIAQTGKPVELVNMREEGSYVKIVDKTLRLSRRMIAEASLMRRMECDLGCLTLCTECGPSNSLSGLAANPAVGRAFDAVIAEGGRAIFSETVENMGAEHIMAKRAVNKDVAKKYLGLISRWEKFLEAQKIDLRGLQPAPENITGGLITIEEKSIGALTKAGSTPLTGAVEYGERPEPKPGLYFMDGPGMPAYNITGTASAGSQLRLNPQGGGERAFMRHEDGITTGTRMPILPSIYVLSMPYELEPNADEYFDIIGGVLEGKESLEELGNRVLREVVDVASGKLTKQEMHRGNRLFFNEIHFSRSIVA